MAMAMARMSGQEQGVKKNILVAAIATLAVSGAVIVVGQGGQAPAAPPQPARTALSGAAASSFVAAGSIAALAASGQGVRCCESNGATRPPRRLRGNP